MKADRKYLRAAEIVALTGMSLRTIRRWIADEILPSVRLGGARIVATADLEAALSAFHYTIQETSYDQNECDDELEG